MWHGGSCSSSPCPCCSEVSCESLKGLFPMRCCSSSQLIICRPPCEKAPGNCPKTNRLRDLWVAKEGLELSSWSPNPSASASSPEWGQMEAPGAAPACRAPARLGKGKGGFPCTCSRNRSLKILCLPLLLLAKVGETGEK